MKKRKKALKKNPKKQYQLIEKKNEINWNRIVSVVTVFTSVVAMLISLITLYQTRKDREAAYKPSILINPIEYSFSWDQGGRIDWINSLLAGYEVESKTEINEDGSINGTVSIPISVIGDGYEQFSAVNVGVGNAKQIVFQWHKSNIENLYHYLLQCDATKEDFLTIDKSMVFDYDGKVVVMSLPTDIALMYMLSDANESYDIPLPSAYLLLIQEIIKSGEQSANMPHLMLTATYSDIQGNEYTDIFLIAIKPQMYTEDQSGAGQATFQLVPLFNK